MEEPLRQRRKALFFKRKYSDKNGIDTWKGDKFFSGNKDLAEFFGIGEDLKELYGVQSGQVFIRIFGTKKVLTDQEKEFWIIKSEGHSGNQVKITKASPELMKSTLISQGDFMTPH